MFEGGAGRTSRPTSCSSAVSHTWNHGLGEIVTSLQEVGMRLTTLVEHDSVPWEALPGLMEKTDGDEWRLADRPCASRTATRCGP